jgi:hypothetical protein
MFAENYRLRREAEQCRSFAKQMSLRDDAKCLLWMAAELEARASAILVTEIASNGKAVLPT